MSSGAEGGAYDAFAKRYREILARSGVELVLQQSAGAAENPTLTIVALAIRQAEYITDQMAKNEI